MKGIIKLFPLNNNAYISKDSIIRYNNKLYNVDEVCNEKLKLANYDGYILKNHCILMKYYIVRNAKIIGELNFNQYKLVNEGEEYEFKTTFIPNKMEIGDEAVLYKVKLSNLELYKFKPVKGIICNIKNRTASLKTFEHDTIIVKRCKIRLLNKPNEKIICTIKI